MEKLKILYLWTKNSLTRMLISNGRQELTPDQLKDEVYRQFRDKDKEKPNERKNDSGRGWDDGVRG